jgi:hypothetical protein
MAHLDTGPVTLAGSWRACNPPLAADQGETAVTEIRRFLQRMFLARDKSRQWG